MLYQIKKSVYEKLCKAQSDLPTDWYFRIYEGFRSRAVQDMLFKQEYKRAILRYPNDDHTKHFHETTGLVSPVNNLDGSLNIQLIIQGEPLILKLLIIIKKLIDMGMAVKDWNTVDPDLCSTNSHLINSEAKKPSDIAWSNAKT